MRSHDLSFEIPGYDDDVGSIVGVGARRLEAIVHVTGSLPLHFRIRRESNCKLLALRVVPSFMLHLRNGPPDVVNGGPSFSSTYS
jgi:hypothetical protein